MFVLLSHARASHFQVVGEAERAIERAKEIFEYGTPVPRTKLKK